GFLGQVVLVVTRLRALGRAAAAALVGAARSDAGVAGALLAEQLLRAAGHLAAALRRVRPGPLVGQVHDHHVVQQLAIDLAAELGGVHLDGADRITLAVENWQCQHRSTRPFNAPPGVTTSPSRGRAFNADATLFLMRATVGNQHGKTTAPARRPK